MRVRLLIAAAAAVGLTACADSSTAPRQMSPGERSADGMLFCRSGYHIATRSDGSQECVSDGGSSAAAAPAATAP